MKKLRSGTLAAIALCALLSACATTGTRVTSNSDVYKSMAKSQQGWCSQFAGTCGCTVDGQPATCSLAATCLNTGSCQRAQ
jgi:outer membrane biogenesis lipoprotein LolB